MINYIVILNHISNSFRGKLKSNIFVRLFILEFYIDKVIVVSLAAFWRESQMVVSWQENMDGVVYKFPRFWLHSDCEFSIVWLRWRLWGHRRE